MIANSVLYKEHLDLYIDFSELDRIGKELMASEKQVRHALWRAMKRTQSAIRTTARKGLAKELHLRRAMLLQKRLKRTRVQGSQSKQECGVWVGLNGMPAYWFKGKPKKTKTGVSFHGYDFPKAFVSKSPISGKYRIRRRVGKERYPTEEVWLPVADRMLHYIDQFVDLDAQELFYENFKRDLKARVKYNVGKK